MHQCLSVSFGIFWYPAAAYPRILNSHRLTSAETIASYCNSLIGLAILSFSTISFKLHVPVYQRT